MQVGSTVILNTDGLRYKGLVFGDTGVIVEVLSPGLGLVKMDKMRNSDNIVTRCSNLEVPLHYFKLGK